MPPTTSPLYRRATRTGNLVFVSGQLPLEDGELTHPGHVGADVTVAQARRAATIAAQRCLDVLSDELGGLDDVVRIVRVGGFVATADGFFDAPSVVDAASAHVIDRLGDRGHHARAAVGVASLPLNACVEIEMIAQC